MSTADVHRFVDTWKGVGGPDSSCAGLSEYLRGASLGLRAYLNKFGVGGRELCAAVRANADRYTALASRLSQLDSAAIGSRVLAAKLAALVPLTNTPSVYFLVGNGISGGTTTGGSEPMMLIGVELNKTPASLPSVIAHELVHTQQDYPFWGSMTGGPAFLRGSVLRHSLKEGTANLIAELVTGVPHRNEYAERHEAELWRDFQRDANSTDYGRWLYNGRDPARGDRPPDLGYWMGYRISKAYYERAGDKRKAIVEMLTIRDFPAFLRASGYVGK